MKNEKNVLLASFLNFIVWGFGYFYLNKHIVKGIVILVFYVLAWLLSVLLVLSGSPLTLSVLFWMIFWSLWCSIFLAYDAYKISHQFEPPLKIKKVKAFVRRSKVRTRKK
jgi:hypothetical protein